VLWLNGREIGAREVGEDACATWTLPFEPGELRVECRRHGEVAQHRLETPESPHRIRLTACPGDGAGVEQIIVELVDAKGRLVTRQDREIAYQICGGAEILGIENANPSDVTGYAQKKRRTYGGRSIVYLRLSGGTQPVTLTAGATGLAGEISI